MSENDIDSEKDNETAADDGDDELSDADDDKAAEAGDGDADSIESLHLRLDTEDVEETQCKCARLIFLLSVVKNFYSLMQKMYCSMTIVDVHYSY